VVALLRPGLARCGAQAPALRGEDRVKTAIEAYSYGHFPIVAGVVVGALGVEGVMEHADETKPLGDFYALALFGGFALYMGGHLFFKHRLHGSLSRPRLITMSLLLVALPAGAALPPLAALAGLVLVLGGLIVFETHRYADVRRSLRDA
jgi:low temperature requirement protein LtrA